ncbi:MULTISPECIES: 5-(carboxyamino)imidazole ribonucleotide synthase [Corallincola]|uniref:N5-carboxyaminoimidazole ribonucleotide synthase n=2 Tax=Corallincola TaxID=1775176 RepID=A0ABY1WLB6_9GAMM|nr:MULTISPECIES: 5-(carboxyamino)imidazole ribonucleotide synthase [Corallincola]TAA41112.1 5-(carboxyamino)imidazole ribonucleotide synthase [Corallincola spongiicola]TCI02763.1 5-(carboxyamino)imidazole ribonucleotide synthase [Corallincola luteus]
MQVLVLGAGQLARMMSLAGAPLGLKVKAYDVRSHTVVHPLTLENYQQDLAAGLIDCDVVTAEFEHIPQDILSQCQASGKFLPGAEAIRIGGDRRLEKQLLDSADVPNAKFQVVSTEADLHQAIASIGLPLVLKSALEGYDGKGQWRLKTTADAAQVWAEISSFLQESSANQAIVAEAWIPFDREVSVIGARGKDGSVKVYPLTQNHHENGILSLSVALTDAEQLQQQATHAFEKLTKTLDYVGVLAIEFFDVDGELLVNEIAPRVHNSGHWTQQGADVCQFENHLRAVCGLAIGNTQLVSAAAMVNVIGTDNIPNSIHQLDGVHLHWYDKDKRAGRKMGHINVCAEDKAELKKRLAALLKQLDEADFPGLHQAAQALV